MALRSEDLKGQREALTEDVEGSGGETDTPEKGGGESKTKHAKEQKTAITLRDSAMPCVMITALLLTFGAIATTAIFVVSRAFGEDGAHDGAHDVAALAIVTNSSRQ